MDFKAAKTALNLLGVRFPDSILTFTGGEPFLYSNLWCLLDEAQKLFKGIVITSNGTFSPDTCERLIPYLKENVKLQISLDGLKDVHDKIRGIGTYDKLIRNVECLTDYWENIYLSTTVSRNNIDSIPLLAQELNKYKFRFWKISLAIEQHPNLQPDISTSEWNKLIDNLLPVCHFRIYTNKLFDFDLMNKANAIIDEHNRDEILYNCGFAKSKFYVFPDFNVYPCTCVDKYCAGNLITDGIDTICNNLDKISSISVCKESYCAQCKYLKVCNGGCPGYSIKFFGKIGMGDIRCPMIQNTIKKS